MVSEEAEKQERFKKYKLLSEALDDFKNNKMNKIMIMTIIQSLFDPTSITQEMIDWAKGVIENYK
jgi:hypothetical protein